MLICFLFLFFRFWSSENIIFYSIILKVRFEVKTKFYEIIITCLTCINNTGDWLLVNCLKCGICCENTVMELSNKDVQIILNKGYHFEEFAELNKSIIRLKNVNGYCFFYNILDKKCKIYEKRPIGCYLYPVVYLENEYPIIDELCPMGYTVSEREFIKKGKILDKFLKKMDNEVQNRKKIDFGNLPKVFTRDSQKK